MSEELQTYTAPTAPAVRDLDLFDETVFGRAIALAQQLSTATGFVPRHLLGNPGACLGVVSLASACPVLSNSAITPDDIGFHVLEPKVELVAAPKARTAIAVDPSKLVCRCSCSPLSSTGPPGWWWSSGTGPSCVITPC